MTERDLRTMPRVDRVVRHALLREPIEQTGLARVTDSVRAAIDAAREAVLAGTRATIPTEEEIATSASTEIGIALRTRATRVINATGVIIHTNLGRAAISKAGVAALAGSAGG